MGILVTTVITLTTVATITNTIVKYQNLLLYSSKDNFLQRSYDQLTNQKTDQPTDLELFRATTNCKEKEKEMYLGYSLNTYDKVSSILRVSRK